MDLISLSTSAAALVAGLLRALAGGVRQQIGDDPLGRLYHLVEWQLQTTPTGIRALEDLTRDPGDQQAVAQVGAQLHAAARQNPQYANALLEIVAEAARSGGSTHATLNVHTDRTRGSVTITGRDNVGRDNIGRDNINKRTKIGTGGIVGIVAGVALLCLAGGAGVVAIGLAVTESGFSVGDCVWQDASSRRLVEADCQDPRSSTVTRVIPGGQNPLAYCGGSEGWYVDERADILYCYRSNAR